MRGQFERTAQRPANLAGRWVLWTDVQYTRRKRYFIVENSQGENRFMSSRISPALEWLSRNEISSYLIATPDATYSIRVLKATPDERF